jgi:hypothetical protein
MFDQIPSIVRRPVPDTGEAGHLCVDDEKHLEPFD